MIDIEARIAEHIRVVERARSLAAPLAAVAGRMVACIEAGGKILWMGNGGSAADSQHLAAELVGRFARERPAVASLALTTDTSVLTALGNDYGFDSVFARQIDALCAAGDVVVGISTSGASANVVAAMRRAKARGATTVAFTGHDGGALRHESDHCLVVPSRDTARIQEVHVLMGHLLCEWVEAALADGR